VTEFAPVLPLKMVKHLATGVYVMLQAHLFNDLPEDEWEQFRDHSGVILDNGVIETGEPRVKTLYKVAKAIEPFEVVCPDAFMDKDKTLKLFHAHALELSAYANSVMVVPQGGSVQEWVECLRQMMGTDLWERIPQLTIGIPKVLDKFPGGRIAALSWVRTHCIRLTPYMGHPSRLHLLGQWSVMSQPIQAISYFPHIRSWDTTCPYAAALQGQVYTEMIGKCNMTEDAWRPEGYLLKETLTLAEINLAIYHKATKMASNEGERMGHG